MNKIPTKTLKTIKATYLIHSFILSLLISGYLLKFGGFLEVSNFIVWVLSLMSMIVLVAISNLEYYLKAIKQEINENIVYTMNGIEILFLVLSGYSIIAAFFLMSLVLGGIKFRKGEIEFKEDNK